ncbi:HNH endonuclease family protein [Burkholderia pseudomultivorans]|uniref:HNH endonuclease family protein n=1 Tax=Burkholderia pseudomultivorans TaxID=1207504 RepID=UPI0022AA957C|nr:HNH endonuclease family protein [Burkholderia pseudomultivorans]
MFLLLRQRNDVVHMIGNLTLVNRHLNPAAGDAAFVTKLSEYQNSVLRMNRYFSEFDEWDEAAITTRSPKHPGHKDHSARRGARVVLAGGIAAQGVHSDTSGPSCPKLMATGVHVRCHGLGGAEMQRHGVALAKAEGKYKGLACSHDYAAIKAWRAESGASIRDAEKFGVRTTTVKRACAEHMPS